MIDLRKSGVEKGKEKRKRDLAKRILNEKMKQQRKKQRIRMGGGCVERIRVGSRRGVAVWKGSG